MAEDKDAEGNTGIDRTKYRPLSLGDMGYAWVCKQCGCPAVDVALHERWHATIAAAVLK